MIATMINNLVFIILLRISLIVLLTCRFDRCLRICKHENYIRNQLHVKSEINDIAFFHYVILAFETD